jgi:hypothetical protein
MTLVQRVEKLREQIAADDQVREKALEDAEALSDLFKDVKPKTYSVPMERFLGLPAFSK